MAGLELFFDNRNGQNSGDRSQESEAEEDDKNGRDPFVDIGGNRRDACSTGGRSAFAKVTADRDAFRNLGSFFENEAIFSGGPMFGLQALTQIEGVAGEN